MSTYGRASRLAIGVALGLTGIVGPVLIASAAEPTRDVDGLVRVDSRQLDHLFVLPGADFSTFKRVKIDPVDVSFSDRWNPNARRAGATRRISTQDIENMKSSVATEFR